MYKESYKIALGGVISSLCISLMFLTSVFPMLSFLLPMIAGALMMIVVFEVNSKWAFLTYLCTSFLSIIITFDKSTALTFIVFFGHYPILKKYIKKISKNRFVFFVFKTIFFNICMILSFLISTYLLGISDTLDEMKDWGKYGAYVLLFMSNIMFFLYDCNLNYLVELYHKWFKKKILCKNNN